MTWKKMYFLPLILLVIALCIHIYSLDASRVESNYSLKIYPAIAVFLRKIFGFFPFSVGDILYAGIGIYIISRFLKYGKKIARKEFKAAFRRQATRKTLKIFNILACIYISFNLFWGINYNRIGVATQLNLEVGTYTPQELVQVNGILLEQVNKAKQSLIHQRFVYPSKSEMYHRVARAFKKGETKYPFLSYPAPTVKSSLWGWLGNYVGFTGYYNPFTGEAQVNSTVPVFTQPFTTAHEIAHQIGYAKEMEANFVGFLATVASEDPALLYSGYLDMFLYANRNLYRTDSAMANRFLVKLLPEVKEDIAILRQFAVDHQNPIEPVIRWGYGVYLRSNQQPAGMLSYSEVTAFVIAFYKKMGLLQ